MDFVLPPLHRITLFAGHYGSGKTNLALNYARYIRRQGHAVTLADLDIVNPYFRTKDSADDLKKAGIDLVVSDYANSNVDFPALPKEIYSLVATDGERGAYVVMDIGGDDRGALALGRYVDDIRASGDYAMFGVINAARPLTQTADDTIEVLREIEAACRLPFTALVNNTNLALETTLESLLASRAYAEEIAAKMGLPIAFTSCEAKWAQALAAKMRPEVVFPLDIQSLYYQDRTHEA